MIRDWRTKWTEGTGGATAAEFPFGWAQLNSDGNPTVWAMGGTQTNRNSSTDPLGEWTSGFSSIRNAESHTLSVENTFQVRTSHTILSSLMPVALCGRTRDTVGSIGCTWYCTACKCVLVRVCEKRIKRVSLQL